MLDPARSKESMQTVFHQCNDRLTRMGVAIGSIRTFDNGYGLALSFLSETSRRDFRLAYAESALREIIGSIPVETRILGLHENRYTL